MWFLNKEIPVNLRWEFKIVIAIIFNLLYLQSATARVVSPPERSSPKAIEQLLSIALEAALLTKYVREEDCAFQALETLERQYDYGDRLSEKKTLTRDKFAMKLNACREKISDVYLSAETTIDRASLDTIARLESDFASELEELRQQTKDLNQRTTQLENNRFSPTARLSGTAIFSVIGYLSKEGENQFALQQQTYLNLSASFTGRDNLSLGLTASNANIPSFGTTNNGKNVGSTREGLTTWEYGGSTENNVALTALEYTFPVIDRQDRQLYLSLAFLDGLNLARSLPSVGYITQQGQEIGSGAISTFGQKNPLHRLGGGAGVIAQYNSDFVGFTAAYLGGQADDPTQGRGLFNGDYLALAQLNLTPSEEFALALTYQHNYFGAGRFAYNNQIQNADTPGFVGTALANRFDNQGVFFDENVAVASNSYGAQAFWEINPVVTIGGFVTKTDARLLGRGNADILSYGMLLNFPDLGREENQAGLIIGVEPTLTNLDAPNVSKASFKRDTSLHVEAFYQHRLTDNISITPGVIWISAPNQDANNPDIVEGVIRTTFGF